MREEENFHPLLLTEDKRAPLLFLQELPVSRLCCRKIESCSLFYPEQIYLCVHSLCLMSLFLNPVMTRTPGAAALQQ
jgi:hypothetical protein